MKCVLSFFLFVVILEVATAQTSQVQELSDGNFLEMVTSHPLVLVEFYSPTCPFCQSLAPEYEKAATALKDSPSGVVLAKVDCTNSLSNITCTKSKVRFVPWVVLFHNGAQVKNFGNRSRDAASIVKFVTENKNLSDIQQDLTIPKIQPENTCDDKHVPAQVANATAEAPVLSPVGPAVTILTDATFTGFLKSSSYVIVDYYTPWCSDCQHLSPLYEDAAAHLRKEKKPIKFAKVDCNQGNMATSTTCGASKLKFYPWMVLYHNVIPVSHFDRENVADTETIYNFINSGAHFDDLPSISTSVKEVDDSSFDTMLTNHTFVLVEFYAPWCFYCKKLTPIYEDIATGLKTSQPDVLLVTVDCTATNTKTRNTCTKNDIAFLPTLKLFQNGKFAKEYEGDKTKKDSILNFINDEISKQQATKRQKLSEKKKEKPSDENKEGSTPDDNELESSKNKTVVKKAEKKEKKHKKNDQTEKKKENMNKAAQILKTVFKQFKKKQHQKSKHRNYDDDDEDDDEGHHDNMKQVAKDIHQIAIDIHKMYKDVHKAQKKQPAVDRLMKAFHRLVKNKDEDEDDL